MKNLKRIIALLMATLMIFGLVACGDKDQGKDSETKTETQIGEEVSVDDLEISDEPVDLTISEQILVDMYDKSPMEFPIMTWEIDITDMAQVKSYTGLENADKIVSAAVSEPAMSSQAYSVVLVELKDVNDGAMVSEEMKNGVDPEKWGDVKADDISVVVEGKYVCLVMISSEYKDMATAAELTAVCVDVIRGGDTEVESAETPTEEDAKTE